MRNKHSTAMVQETIPNPVQSLVQPCNLHGQDPRYGGSTSTSLASSNSARSDTRLDLNTSSALVNSQLVPQVKSMSVTDMGLGPNIRGTALSIPQSPPGYRKYPYEVYDEMYDSAADTMPCTMCHGIMAWVKAHPVETSILVIAIGGFLLTCIHAMKG